MSATTTPKSDSAAIVRSRFSVYRVNLVTTCHHFYFRHGLFFQSIACFFLCTARMLPCFVLHATKVAVHVVAPIRCSRYLRASFPADALLWDEQTLRGSSAPNQSMLRCCHVYVFASGHNMRTFRPSGLAATRFLPFPMSMTKNVFTRHRRASRVAAKPAQDGFNMVKVHA